MWKLAWAGVGVVVATVIAIAAVSLQGRSGPSPSALAPTTTATATASAPPPVLKPVRPVQHKPPKARPKAPARTTPARTTPAQTTPVRHPKARPKAPARTTPARTTPAQTTLVRQQFMWAPVAGADSYEVAFYRNGARVFTDRTHGTSIEIGVARSPSGSGGRRVLPPGTYTWYVWPWRGGHRAASAVVASKVVLTAQS
jgi:hypothetical protein